MQNGLWYTASIMASEAEFIEPPPEIETVMTSNHTGTTKRHNPSKLSQMSLSNILRAIDNPNLSAKLSEINTEYQASRRKSLLSLCLKKMPLPLEPEVKPDPEIYQKSSNSKRK